MMKKVGVTLCSYLLLGSPLGISAFSGPSASSVLRKLNVITTDPRFSDRISTEYSRTVLFAEDQKNNKNAPFDEAVRSKLLTESIAPWRTLRSFLYISLGSGALLGGLISLSGLAAALSKQSPDLDLNTEYLNLAIDFGAVALFAFLYKFDADKGKELQQNVELRIEKKKDNKVIQKAMKEREATLGKLMLNIRISNDGATQDAMVEAVQQGGKQHMIIVAGPRKAIRDALLGANLLKMEFAMRDVLVVPYDTDRNQSGIADSVRPDASKAFGETTRPTWETQPYVATVVGEGWGEYIQAELDDAVKQSGEKSLEDGIAIVVANTGKVIRRGVGQVPWREMVAELEQEVKEEGPMDLGFLSG